MIGFTPLQTFLFLLFSSIWIIGFAIIFAALSFHHYQAGVDGVTFRQQLNKPAFQRLLWIGMTLVSIGFTWDERLTWQTFAFGALAIMSGYQAFLSISEYRAQTQQNL